jgi:hypothetical protein
VLVAQLMKSQAFLREMANYVFKQFCTELDQGTLANLISIISTPNERASEMVGSEGEEESANDSEDSVNEEYGAEVSEDSDLL